MSAGLANILNVDTSFVANSAKKISELYPTGTTLGDRISDIKPNYLKEKFEIDDSSDSTVRDKQQFIVDMIDIQLLDLVDDSDDLDYDDLAALVTPQLSYEASVVRNDIIAWILGRMSADIETTINALDREFGIWTKSFDVGLKSLSALEKLFSNSSPSSDSLAEYVALLKSKSDQSLVEVVPSVKEILTIDGLLLNRMSLLRIKIEPKDFATNARFFNENLKVSTVKNTYKQALEILLKTEELLRKATNNTVFNDVNTEDRIDQIATFLNSQMSGLGHDTTPALIIYRHEDITDDEFNKLSKVAVILITKDDISGIHVEVDLPTFDANNNNQFYQQNVNKNILLAIIEPVKAIVEANKTLSDNFKDFVSTAGKRLYNAIPELTAVANSGIDLYKAIEFDKYTKLKSGFARAADCTGNVSTVLQENLSYINSGHFLDSDGNPQPIDDSSTS